MIFTCKCLNFSINTGSNPVPMQSLDPVSVANHFELSNVEQADSFFSKNLKAIKIESLSKAQESLVMAYKVGTWIIHKCLNCKLDVYASKKDDILITDELLSDPGQIKELKQASSFSSVFNIVLQPNISADVTRSNNRPLSDSDPLSKSSRLSSLNQQVSKHIGKLSSDIEEKIRQFSDEQYSILDKERTRVQEDHQTLVNLLKESDTGSLSATNNTSFSSFSNHNIEFKYNNNRSALNVANTRPGEVSTACLSSSVSARNSSDASDDFMFELEDVDHSPGATAPSEEEMSDTDDSGSHDEGISIPRKMNVADDFVAKSLPMNIPIFNDLMKQNSTPPREAGRIIPKKKFDKDLRDTQDIAASIKALAKSVHGDTPFGDLPRPRLSSQI